MKDDEVSITMSTIDAIKRWRTSKKCIIISVVLIVLLIVVVAITTAVVSKEGEFIWREELI